MDQPSGERFRAFDRLLDKALSGQLWLRDPRIAQCVVEILRRGAHELGQYNLHSFVVMANHVHLLLEARVSVGRIMNGIKGVTARQANLILERTGRRFWQDESFDHWVRNRTEFERIRAYIEQNPVKAGLVKRAEGWLWSSASR